MIAMSKVHAENDEIRAPITMNKIVNRRAMSYEKRSCSVLSNGSAIHPCRHAGLDPASTRSLDPPGLDPGSAGMTSFGILNCRSNHSKA
jgi:hypothetical protein